MTLSKTHLITSVYRQITFPKSYSIGLVESLLETIKSTLELGEDLLISGFGKFEVKDKNQRKGRNPATGNDLILGARRVVTFKCSGVLREKLNGK